MLCFLFDYYVRPIGDYGAYTSHDGTVRTRCKGMSWVSYIVLSVQAPPRYAVEFFRTLFYGLSMPDSEGLQLPLVDNILGPLLGPRSATGDEGLYSCKFTVEQTTFLLSTV